ncbi:TPA: NADH:flavorubredoxin reductase NorW [Vibrio vulnificus]|nr:NADH:flavorubredoxin reductase NorW [Vibrio vulnificus]
MMSDPIIIIGSGFAAYQLVKSVRRLDAHIPIQIFTADDGAEYNKPDLSHVFSKRQTAADLVVKSGEAFATEHNVQLHVHTQVERVLTQQQQVVANGRCYPYSKLVFATGAQAFVPPMRGDGLAKVMTLNSLQEYQAAEQPLSRAQHVLVIGGGLIGVEIALDLATSGKQVTVVEPNARLLANLLPEFIALPLEQQLMKHGIQLALNSRVESVTVQGQTLAIALHDGREFAVDAVLCAAGLKANTAVAREAGLSVERGICVDLQLNTSDPHIYALGDCAQIEGRMLPYLQPIVLSANVLAKQLVGQEARLTLPPMMVKVKTPSYPIQLAGDFLPESHWQVQLSPEGIVAKAQSPLGDFTGFVVTGKYVTQAFPLLRELSQRANG